ncbi:hypothetical protein HAX54_034858 [Datura stramonium]|uniref:Uncharacterized protein n=1 Tax=Datura stramonium TaxID=4076 RepID=A0ABS8VH93_DATST|nr:hypothetical protein [Datura stramonium]
MSLMPVFGGRRNHAHQVHDPYSDHHAHQVANLHGYKKEDVKVQVEDDKILKITGEKGMKKEIIGTILKEAVGNSSHPFHCL